MYACWNHPSYRQLERLLPELRSEQPMLASHLARTFFTPRRRVLAAAYLSESQIRS
jgi:hypothetical protein